MWRPQHLVLETFSIKRTLKKGVSPNFAKRAFRKMIDAPRSAAPSGCPSQAGKFVERQIAKADLPQFQHKLQPCRFKIPYPILDAEVVRRPDRKANHIDDRQQLINAIFHRRFDFVRKHA